MRVRSTVAVFFAVFAASALAQNQPAAPAAPPKPMTVEKSSVPGTVGGGQAEQITAKVKAIDVDKRLITLKGPKGEVDTFEVGPDVKNLPQVKVGDSSSSTSGAARSFSSSPRARSPLPRPPSSPAKRPLRAPGPPPRPLRRCRAR
ncbi:MAG: hypothetical protein NTY18_06950 [Deltaproteobacteria bacterium]|nr:hypothetical protein [Deltaproteobacteria bacterium]